MSCFKDEEIGAHRNPLRFYLFDRDSTSRGSSRGRGRSRLPAEQGAQQGSIPGRWDHDLSKRQMLTS